MFHCTCRTPKYISYILLMHTKPAINPLVAFLSVVLYKNYLFLVLVLPLVVLLLLISISSLCTFSYSIMHSNAHFFAKLVQTSFTAQNNIPVKALVAISVHCLALKVPFLNSIGI